MKEDRWDTCFSIVLFLLCLLWGKGKGQLLEVREGEGRERGIENINLLSAGSLSKCPRQPALG